MHFLTKNVTDRSLFLIDEFGTGTDPQFGGSIAEAVLEMLSRNGGTGIVTTHYSNLKNMAGEGNGIVNAAMRFDREKMQPLYELEIGIPGSSFSFEIARNMGLPRKVLDRAKQKVGIDRVQLEKMLSEVQSEKLHLQKQRDQLSQINDELTSSMEDFKAKRDSLEKEKKTIINEAKAHAKELLDQSNRKIESIIRRIRESGAEKEYTKELRKDLDRFKNSLHQGQKSMIQSGTPLLEIEVGDSVQIEGQETAGEVLAIFKKDAEILMGGLKSRVRLNRLQLVQKKSALAKKSSIGKKYGLDLTQRSKAFSTDLDLRGKRADEALAEVDRHLDDALLLGVERIRIIHGIGQGILREVIRKHLDNSDYISEVEDEETAQGGAGVSVVYLR